MILTGNEPHRIWNQPWLNLRSTVAPSGVVAGHMRMSRYMRRWASKSKGMWVKLCILTAVLGGLATTACARAEEGIRALETESDGTLVALASSYGGGSSWFDSHGTSQDGGLTWIKVSVSEHRSPSERARAQGVETPRGTYTIEGTDVVRSVGETRDIAFSAAYLREAGNINLQEHDTRGMAWRHISTGPYAIVYDDRVDHVIVAMGLQGAVVGTADGHWIPVIVGDYRPSDFSLIRKSFLLRDPYLWLVTLALALSFSAFGLVLSEPLSQHQTLPSLGSSIVRSIILLSIPPAVAMLIVWLMSSLKLTSTPMPIIWSVFQIFAVISTVLLSKNISFLHRDKSLDLVPSVIAVTSSILGLQLYSAPGPLEPLTYVPTGIGLLLAVRLVLSSYRRLWSLPRTHRVARRSGSFVLSDSHRLLGVIAAALAGMHILVAGSVLLWVHYGTSLVLAQAAAVTLLTLAAFALQKYVTRSQAGRHLVGP